MGVGMGTQTAAPFYLPSGDGFLSTEHTRGPWSAHHQHAGPPCGLLVRAAERLRPDLEVARLSADMLRPVPIGPVQVDAVVEKPGRRAAVVRARVLAVDAGLVCIDARVLMVRQQHNTPVVSHPLAVALGPDDATPYQSPFPADPVGYHSAMELRRAAGAFGSGRMAVWMRQRGPLVLGEAPSPAQRVLVAADAGSGVSVALDPAQWTFANVDLSVHLLRPLFGDWVLVDGQSSFADNGRGLADTVLSDVRGRLGRGTQTLLVEPVGPLSPGP
jgi:hypothetical protein